MSQSPVQTKYAPNPSECWMKGVIFFGPAFVIPGEFFWHNGRIYQVDASSGAWRGTPERMKVVPADGYEFVADPRASSNAVSQLGFPVVVSKRFDAPKQASILFQMETSLQEDELQETILYLQNTLKIKTKLADGK